jgi:SAM-dependent methyltransferase
MISCQEVISFLKYAANINILWKFIVQIKIPTMVGHPHVIDAIIMRDNSHPYVHGHSDRESERLHYQASKLAELLHDDTRYPPKSRVLEAACGVGAQTVILTQNSPGAEFMSVDISPESLAKAKDRVLREGITNATFRQADIYDLPFGSETFDHIFVCFLLEHLPDPLLALINLKWILRPKGTITVIEGDHGSALFYPDSSNAHRVIDCLVQLQRQTGGNALIGRELRHLLTDAGFMEVTVSPRQVYADQSRPESIEGVKNIFIAMVEGVREPAIKGGLVDIETWEKGIRDLYRTTEQDGSFCYTFFKAVGIKEGSK